MLFGAMVTPRVSDWMLIKEIENMGFGSAWIPDSHMIYSDTYAVLSLAAANTSKIKLGTGIAVAPTRIAPVTAHSIATINQLAPGRTFLGIGTGHTGMRVMGMDPIKIGEFREYLRVTRALLHGEEIDYTLNGETRDIKFLHPDDGFINVESPVPIYVAADGPLALKAAGIYGDGRICSHNQSKALLKDSLETIKLGAKKAQRVLPKTFNTTVLTYACVLQPGESITSERVIDEIGSMAIASLHYWWELYKNNGDTSTIARSCQGIWEEYLEFTERMEIPLEKRYQKVHLGHCAYILPEERRFVTENLIRSTGGLVGTPEEIIDMIRDREAMGLTEIALLPGMEFARKNLSDFSAHVIERY